MDPLSATRTSPTTPARARKLLALATQMATVAASFNMYSPPEITTLRGPGLPRRLTREKEGGCKPGEVWKTNPEQDVVALTPHGFESSPEGKGERYLQQVIGSANYRTGGDLNDYLHLWLNYQIEHHIFPDLSMLQYQRMQPKVRALCERHGIPYVQESVWTRARKMVDVVVGKSSMRRMASLGRSKAGAADPLPDVA